MVVTDMRSPGTSGLSASEAAVRLAEHGPNSIAEPRRRSILDRAVSQLRDPMIMLLLGAAVVTALLGDRTDTGVIAVVIVLNAVIGVVQEVRAEHAMSALRSLAAPTATVVRDGRPAALPAAILVPDDVVLLEAGDVVPADGSLLEAHQLQVDESAMTGESVPVECTVDADVQAGTTVTRGRARMMVTRTGVDSGLGRIARLLASTPTRATPLQQRLTGLSRALVIGVVTLAGVVLALGLLQGRDFTDMLIVAVSLAVAAVPESLPAVVAVALALGAHRMAKRSAIVRRLPAVETMGSVTVLASDKTGTLTEGRMFAERLETPSAVYVVTGAGYAPSGTIVPDGGDDAELKALLRDIALCNNARLVPSDDGGDWSPLGDPFEAALLSAAANGAEDPELIRNTWQRVAEIPFDSHSRRMTTLHVCAEGRWLLTTKGAPEVVLDSVADLGQATAARASAAGLARNGHRVIAVADGEYDVRPDLLTQPLRFAGLVAVADPPRATAREVVDACRAAGVRLVLVTGDHRNTAVAIADRLGLRDDHPLVLDGDDIEDGVHAADLDGVGVFARAHPEHKVAIIDALQAQGHVVAMTGDGVNDGPALRRADIGVAMGSGGTEVARQAAELVLADDDLRSVIAAVEEGRRIFSNIRAFLRYAISGGLAEIAVMLAAPLLGLGIPLLPAQILWINMLTHGLPGVAFGAEPLDPGVMHRPSRSPRESVLGDGLAGQIAVTGALIAVTTLAAGMWAHASGASVESCVFLTLGMAQLGVALAVRSPVPHRGIRQRALEAAVACAAVLQLAGVFVAPFQDLLGTQPVAMAELWWLLALSAIPGALVVAFARGSRRRESGGTWPDRIPQCPICRSWILRSSGCWERSWRRSGPSRRPTR